MVSQQNEKSTQTENFVYHAKNIHVPTTTCPSIPYMPIISCADMRQLKIFLSDVIMYHAGV